MDPRPTAVFAANDAMALGVLSALQEAGLRVPEEMAVTGFDDIPIARFLTPPLTTVRLAIADLGGLAVRRLLAAIAEGEDRERRHETLPTTLVVRESCGAQASQPVSIQGEGS
jgi:LacI family transcriptional regulator